MKNKKQMIVSIMHCHVLSLFIMVPTLFISSFGYKEGVFNSYFQTPMLLIYNFLPILFMILLIYALTRGSLRIAFLATSTFWLLLAAANALKVFYRHEVIKVYDYDLVLPLIKIAPRYMHELSKITLLPIVLVLVILLIVTYSLPKKLALPRFDRFVIILIVLSLVGFSYAPYQNIKTSFDIGKAAKLEPYIEIENSIAAGFVYSFIHQSQLTFKTNRKNFDKVLGKSELSQYTSIELPDDKKAHVFVMLVESYKDFSQENSLAFVKDPYTYLHLLKNESVWGNLMPDVYGGGTIKTELDVLTGNNCISHYSYYRTKKPSFVDYFKSNGYFTEAIHPHDGYFYNRVNIYPNIGFDNFLYSENYFYNEGSFPDKDLFDALMFRYKNRADPKQFYFNYTATMQGHGPYGSVQWANDYLERKTGLPEEEYATLNNYFGNVDNTGFELWQLTRQFEEEQEPIVFVFFGDHSPSISEMGYRALGMEINSADLDQQRAQFQTPYLIWANQAGKALFQRDFKGRLPDIDPDLLLPTVFGYLGWKGDAYNQYLQNYAKTLPVTKENYVFYQSDYTNKLTDDINALKEKRDAVEGYRNMR